MNTRKFVLTINDIQIESTASFISLVNNDRLSKTPTTLPIETYHCFKEAYLEHKLPVYLKK
jgi:hypothetical protein